MRPGHLTKCFRHGCAFRLSVLTCLAKKSTKTRRRKKKKKSVYGSSEGLVGFCLNGGLECFAKAACGWGEARRRVSLGLCLHTAAQKAWLSSHPLPETPCFHLMHFALRKKKLLREMKLLLLGIWFVFTQTRISTHGLSRIGGRCWPSMCLGVAQILKTLSAHLLQ